MSDVLVGSAYGVMSLRYEQFTKGVSAVEQQIARLQALSKTPIVVQAQIAAPGAGIGSGAAPLATRAPSGGGAADFDRLQRAQAALEAGQARLARTQGDSARAAQLEAQAQQRLTDVLSAQSGVTVQSIATERQLATVQQQSARAAVQAAQQRQRAAQQEQDSLRNSLRPQQSAAAGSGAGLPAGLGVVAPALVVQQLASFGIAAGKSSLELDRTLRLTRELTGSQQQYTQVITASRHQQELYGGSLQENIAGIQGLVVTSRSTGAELKTLINLSGRLAVLDPAQGAEGARIALSEVLSGDPRSLARRYEIPLAALEKIKDESVPVAERLLILDQYLNKIGITSAIAEKAISADARALHQLGAVAEDAKNAIGSGLARAAGATAQDAVAALDTFSGGREKFADGISGLIGISQNLVGLPPQIGAVAQANRDFGDSFLGWLGFARSAQPTLDSATNAALSFGNSLDEDRQRLGAAQLAHELHGRAVEDDRQAVGRLQLILGTSAGDLQRSAEASALDAAQKDLHAASVNRVAAETRLAADAFLALNPNLDASQAFAAAAAQGLSPLVAQVIALRIEADKTRAALLGAKLQNQSASSLIGTNSEEAQLRASNRAVLQDERTSTIAKAQADARAAEKARTDQLIRTGSAAQVVAQRQREYNETVKQFGKDSAQAITAQTTLIEAQKAAQKTGGVGRVSAAQSTAQQLNTVEQNSGLALLKTQRENLERLRDQQEDFEVRRSRRVEDFEAERRRLLAQGQRGQAARLSETFARDQRREQEDFDRQRRRTLRNNAEGTGDIDARTDLRQQQIGQRAALRGVRVPDLGQAPPTLGGVPAGSARAAPQSVAQIVIQGVINLDGKAVGTGVWPTIEVLMDEELAISLAAIGAPGSGQQALAGVG